MSTVLVEVLTVLAEVLTVSVNVSTVLIEVLTIVVNVSAILAESPPVHTNRREVQFDLSLAYSLAISIASFSIVSVNFVFMAFFLTRIRVYMIMHSTCYH